MHIIDINELPADVQNDICENLLEVVPYLRDGGFDVDDVRDNLLNLAEEVPVLTYMAPTHEFETQAGQRLVSEVAIKNLDKVRQGLLVNGKELDPVLISKDRFIDGGHRFELWRRKGLEQFPVCDIHNLISMDWEAWMEGQDISVPIPEKSKEDVVLEVYHGSFWVPGEDEPDEHTFTEPDGSYNDFGVTYFSNRQDVAERFSSYNLTPDERSNGAMQVILKGKLSLPGLIRKDSYELQRNPYIEFPEGDEIHINDRESLYDRLRTQNAMALVVTDEYGDGDDIAVLEDGLFSCESIALMRSDGSFTDFLDPEKAIDLFNRHVRTLKNTRNSDPEFDR